MTTHPSDLTQFATLSDPNDRKLGEDIEHADFIQARRYRRNNTNRRARRFPFLGLLAALQNSLRTVKQC